MHGGLRQVVLLEQEDIWQFAAFFPSVDLSASCGPSGGVQRREAPRVLPLGVCGVLSCSASASTEGAQMCQLTLQGFQ
eukprot:6027638-Amphidinium_carterae.1